MTVRSRCPVGLLRGPVRSVKLQGTSFPEGARRLASGARGLGGRIPLSREQRRPGASPLGWASRPSYSERNRSQTVLGGADRCHPVGGPAPRAALSSPVGPSPAKSREPWLVLSSPDRLNRTLPVARAQRPEATPLRATTPTVRIPARWIRAVRIPAVRTPAVEMLTVQMPNARALAVQTPTTQIPATEPPAMESPAVRTSAKRTPAAQAPAGPTRALPAAPTAQSTTSPRTAACRASRARCATSSAATAPVVVPVTADGAVSPRPTARSPR